MAFCVNCGERLVDGAKFCHECGAPAGVVTENINQRRQEYIGKILKCPGCGAAVNETTAICPECGIRITGRAAVDSVQSFKDQLMAIESSRQVIKRRVFDFNYAPNPADSQKLALIRNFPIPNSVDDIFEFVMLAIANINVSLSKNTLTKRMDSCGGMETYQTIDMIISDAWVSKLQQAYQKAEIIFPNDPVFAKIQKIYLGKMKELKIKI